MNGRATALAVLSAGLASACVPYIAPPHAPTVPVVQVPRASLPVAPSPSPRRAGFELDSDFAQGGLLRGRAPSNALIVTLDGEEVELADDGRFVIGFDRDAGQQALLVASLTDGSTVTERLAVAPTAWDVQRVNVAFRPAGQSDEEYAERRRVEVGQIAAARALDTGAEGWREPLRWPAVSRISGHFGNQRIYRGGVEGSPHSGVDIAVPRGTPVLAPADGVVVLASDGEFALEGNLLIVDHGHGLSSAFLHLDRIGVKAGDRIIAGQPIAQVGATGRATGPHLHWTLRWKGQRLDPERAVERPRS